APCTSTAPSAGSRPRETSILYAVSQAVGRHAASAKVSSAGLGTRFRAGTATRSARGPGKYSDKNDRVRPSPLGSLISEYPTTTLPSASIPAASQPRIIGSWSSRSPTPRSDHRSWWLSALARTSTVDQPSRAGSGCSPTPSAASGSSLLNAEAYAARMPADATVISTTSGTSGKVVPITAWPGDDAVGGGRRRYGRRHRGGHPRVERARHDRLAAQLVGDDRRDRVRGGDLHALRYPGRAGVQGTPEHTGKRQHVVDLVWEVNEPGRDDGRVPARARGAHLGHMVSRR